MSFNDIFDKYRNIKDSSDSLFTIVTYNTKACDIIESLNHKLELSKTLKNPKKKANACKRLYELIEYMKEYNEDKEPNSVFLVGNVINEINLDKQWLEVLKYFDVDKFIFKYNDTYEIDYLKDLFTDDSFKHVINIKNNSLTHIHLNPTKKRIHHQEETKSMDLDNYIKSANVKEKCLFHGVSVALKNFKPLNHFVFTKQLKDEEIFEVFRKDIVTQVHKELQEYLDYIPNEKLMNRIVFGKDINKKIMTMELQAIYCIPDMHKKILEKVPSQYLNFKLVKVESLENGDPSDILKNNYSGAIGVTYF